MSDARSGIGGAEPVVDVDDSHAGGATVQHAQKRSDAAKACTVADAGGDGDDGHAYDPAHDRRQRALHSSHYDHHCGPCEHITARQQPVDSRNADIR
jgi:hypothetical protein